MRRRSSGSFLMHCRKRCAIALGATSNCSRTILGIRHSISNRLADSDRSGLAVAIGPLGSR